VADYYKDTFYLLLFSLFESNKEFINYQFLINHRFILHYGIPLERFIRYELACRGHNKEHQWCGYEKAKEIWLK